MRYRDEAVYQDILELEAQEIESAAIKWRSKNGVSS